MGVFAPELIYVDTNSEDYDIKLREKIEEKIITKLKRQSIGTALSYRPTHEIHGSLHQLYFTGEQTGTNDKSQPLLGIHHVVKTRENEALTVIDQIPGSAEGQKEQIKMMLFNHLMNARKRPQPASVGAQIRYKASRHLYNIRKEHHVTRNASLYITRSDDIDSPYLNFMYACALELGYTESNIVLCGMGGPELGAKCEIDMMRQHLAKDDSIRAMRASIKSYQPHRQLSTDIISDKGKKAMYALAERARALRDGEAGYVPPAPSAV